MSALAAQCHFAFRARSALFEFGIEPEADAVAASVVATHALVRGSTVKFYEWLEEGRARETPDPLVAATIRPNSSTGLPD